MILENSPKIYNNYKCDKPENTVRNIEKGFKKIDLDISYKDVTYSNNNSLIFNGIAYIDLLGWNQNGKGLTTELAKASAYAEIAERFSTGFIFIKIPTPRKTDKFHELLHPINIKSYLKGFQKINDISLISYQNLETYFKGGFSLNIYEIFKNEGILDYSADAYSIIKNKMLKIPIGFVELLSLSNGIAAGNTLEEAISQASFEIFERYAVHEIIHKNIICPTIDAQSIENEDVQKCIDFLNSIDIEVIIKDFSLNNKIPVICVLFINKKYRNSKNPISRQKIYKRINAGSHLNLYEAILRCFTEYMQSLTYEVKDCDTYDKLYELWTNIMGKEYHGTEEKSKYLTRKYEYYGDLSFLEKGETISFQKLKNSINNDSLSDVKEIEEICISNKWDFLVVDYTHKIIQFPTVRVIIPPISTDFDLFQKKVIKTKNFEDRINTYYGINDFLKYITKDDWINNKTEIKKLISNLEEYISKELGNFDFFIGLEVNFFQWINIFYILPFLYFAIDDYETAKKYFKINKELNIKNPVDSTFYNAFFYTKYNPDIYDMYIKIADFYKEKNKHFSLDYNPFDSDNCRKDQEQLYYLILEKISNSFW